LNSNGSKKKPEILIVAGEASSELYASRIIEEFITKKSSVHFFGIGSKRMESLGCEVVEYSEKMAVVGLWEVLKHWKTIYNAFNNIVALAKVRKPELALLLDYPDFNLRLAKKLKSMGVPVIYYISPQVWAWRTSRVHLIKKIVTKMLVVFPFELDFYTRFKVPATFVGHPLLDELAKQNLNSASALVTRELLGVKKDEFLIALLPGSRESELNHNLQTQIAASELIASQKKNVRFLLLVAPSLEVDFVKEKISQDLKINMRLVKDDPLKVLHACDAAIVASGTATLIAGLAQVPMVIMYKMNALTGFLAKILVRMPKYFGMANLILDDRGVPELFQEAASPQNIAHEILRYVDDPEYRNRVIQKLSTIKNKLGDGGANSRVVVEIEKLLNAPPA
jgi:lipid-A-disaccharide synthase